MAHRANRQEAPRIPPVYRRPNFWRDNIEGLLGAILLVLIMRHFVFEVFKIPTGSMAPSLVGQHQPVECPNCDFPFDVDAAFTNELYTHPFQVRDMLGGCPNCGQTFDIRDEGKSYPQGIGPRFLALFRDGIRGGNRIIVNKFGMAMGLPKRWNIIVFEHVQRDPPVNYIKRLVGLPGETIAIHNGDVYADGKLLRKPPRIQDEMWQPVYDTHYEAREPILGHLPWRKLVGDMREEDKGLLLVPDETGRARVEYGVPILDFPSYLGSQNAFTRWWEDDRYVEVGDLKCEVRAKLGNGKTLRVFLRERELLYTAEVRFENGNVKAVIEQAPWKLTGCDQTTGGGNAILGEAAQAVDGQDHLIAFSNSDQRLRLLVDGKLLIEKELPADQMPIEDSPTPSKVMIEVDGVDGDTRLDRIRIWRDVYHRPYIGPGGHEVRYSFDPLDDKQYFVLGDNTRSSSDSRYWGSVNEEHLIGTALVIWWPLGYLRPIHAK
jgi:signal peptidase I